MLTLEISEKLTGLSRRVFNRLRRPETLINERRAPKEIIGALLIFLNEQTWDKEKNFG